MNDVPFFYGDLFDAFANVRQVELNDLRSGRGWVKTSPEGRRQAGQARTGDPDRPGMGRPPSRNEMAIGRRRWWWRRVRTSDPSKTSEQKTPGHGHPVAGQQHHHNDLQASVFLEWQSALSSELDNSFSFLLLQMQWMLIVLLLLGLLTGLHKLGTYFPRPDGFSLALDPNLWQLLLLLLQIKSAPMFLLSSVLTYDSDDLEINPARSSFIERFQSSIGRLRTVDLQVHSFSRFGFFGPRFVWKKAAVEVEEKAAASAATTRVKKRLGLLPRK